jgi:hypothetical protein
MNQEIQALWTGALRSGDYAQGSGVLKTQTGEFCCLGVLCELAAQAGVIPPVAEIKSLDNPDHVIGYQYGSETGVLPNAVQVWAGLDDIEGTYEMTDAEMTERYGKSWRDDISFRKTSLINANDSYGKSFEQIADLIEEHFSN